MNIRIKGNAFFKKTVSYILAASLIFGGMLINELKSAAEDNVEVWTPDFEGKTIIIHCDRNAIDIPDVEPASVYEESLFEMIEWLESKCYVDIQFDVPDSQEKAVEEYKAYVDATKAMSAETISDEDTYHIWILDNDSLVYNLAHAGYMYDMSTFSSSDGDIYYHIEGDLKDRRDSKEMYCMGDSEYGIATRNTKSGIGVYYNKQYFYEAGIEPDSLYFMQACGKWDWEYFEKMIWYTSRDLNGDGVDDICGLTYNKQKLFEAAIASNGGFEYSNNENIMKKINTAQEWANSICELYKTIGGESVVGSNNMDNAVDDATDEYSYRQAFLDGKAAMLIDDVAAGAEGGWLAEGLANRKIAGSDDGLVEGLCEDSEIGFVLFPTGPDIQNGDYKCYREDSVFVVPSCYNAETAESLVWLWEYIQSELEYYDLKYSGDVASYCNGVFDVFSRRGALAMMSMDEYTVRVGFASEGY